MDNAAPADAAGPGPAPDSAAPDNAAPDNAAPEQDGAGSAARSRPAWLFVFYPRWLAWHAFAVVAFWGMLWLGDWQYHRALGGNGLSWAYTFEWPLFAVFGAVFWARTIRDEYRIRTGKVPDPKKIRELEAAAAEARALAILDPARPKAITSGPAITDIGLGITQADDWNKPWETEPEDDPELDAYNAYLARLHTEVKNHGKWHGLR
jgi:hypothetical protein